MSRCLVSFGANLGDAAQTIQAAAHLLRERLGLEDRHYHLSRLFKTPPVGGPAGQPPFVNAVAAIETDRSEWQVWAVIRELEMHFGRERNQRWEARKLDLDILLYDNHRIWTPHLKIPHPRMCMRRFILLPACDVAANWLDPVSNLSLQTLASNLQNQPANLCLVSTSTGSATNILAEVARLSGAQWSSSSKQHIDAPVNLSVGRWVEMLASSNLGTLSNSMATNLWVFLAAKTELDGVAWEDYHRNTAAKLNLIPGSTGAPWNLPGARYLLASDDTDWAVHELVAALEAMDCPVEALG